MTNSAPTPLPAIANRRDRCIVDDVADYITTYMVLPSREAALVLATWAVHTHAFKAAYATPYIYVNSMEPGCGKSTLLELLEYIVQNGGMSASITTASLYREMANPAAPRPTMLIDEVDALFNGAKNETMRGVLNSGYQHRGQVKVTLPGKNKDEVDPETGEITPGNDVVTMPTFCPKMLAGIDNGELPPTLQSRSITITLRKKRSTDTSVQRFLPRRVERIALPLHDAIAEWAVLNLDAITEYEPEWIDEMDDRTFQICEPLLQVAHVAGCEEDVTAALLALTAKPKKALTQEQKVLKAARDYFETTGHDRVTSATLETATGYNGKLIGSLLAKFDIRSTTLNKGHDANPDRNAKGYYARQFEDAIATYLTDANA